MCVTTSSTAAGWLRQFGSLAAVVVVLAAPPAVQAATIQYTAVLDGASVAPPNASPATGLAVVTFDLVLDTMRVEAAFSGLVGTTTASHIHCCTVNPVDLSLTAAVATMAPSFTGFPVGVTSGTYDFTYDMTLASSYQTAFITLNGGTVAGAYAALLAGAAAGQSYFALHSTEFPGGEIRGFLRGLPEPASLLLLGAGLLGATARRRRRS